MGTPKWLMVWRPTGPLKRILRHYSGITLKSIKRASDLRLYENYMSITLVARGQSGSFTFFTPRPLRTGVRVIPAIEGHTLALNK